MASEKNNVTLEKIVSLCKRRGFVFPTADMYGGLNGVYDFGPLGYAMKQNIKKMWTKQLSLVDHDIVMIDGAILGHHAMWSASGHVDSFSDPMVDCLICKKRYRADEINLEKACVHCGNHSWTEARQFKLMFETQIGAMSDAASTGYLRPETAQSIFVNFKNVLGSSRVKIPFGIGQIGKAFRNEITPKQFLFRMREFEQMELEFFCKPEESDSFFDFWKSERYLFYKQLGLDMERIRFRDHAENELAHYSKKCTDVEYEFPFGWKELEGIAHRGSFDLQQHIDHAKKDLSVFEEATRQSYVPHVVETSVGVDRLFLTLLFDAYREDTVDGESRTLLRLHPAIAPVQAAVLPLVKKLDTEAHKIIKHLKKHGYAVQYDASGSIGKRYRRQDEIGTPVCFTVDFETAEDGKVTARNRDTLEQVRIPIDELDHYLQVLMAA
ncbi:glycine--tRNA ligase [Candidatus Babeliales bacterium]|nr:glycine--tRNA ligase [Candidatus Babeliales bacterium]